MKTFSAKAQEVERKWWVIDAADQVVGRVAVNAANILRGKNKPIFTNHVDTGDNVIIVNAEKAVFTGKKETDKTYTSFSGYVGGHKSTNPERMRQKHPERILEKAIFGMIPHNRLGSAVLRKLHVYAGSSHPHEAQQPQAYKLV
ncbi:large subunit ribosomal protein L13 [Roseimicrobium gellanilyticum]|uniref:Large ribosomal subunit protein uL13 n=1 Tax=Roseimicrobium gellanilyticum TaxID=748857 RepID=A0A366H335_9BACT|nr:50S ribosomal protein L13 [Roseimicrobium gellanilyticum]RBP35700.1 large subunit ribosomal protein L13 [Roseimicrobium gellanilyticum]